MTTAVTSAVAVAGPGTRTVRRLTARLLAATVLLTSPAWLHGAVTQAPAMAAWWNYVVIGLVVVTALNVVAAGVVGVTVRGPAALMAGAVAVGVITWPSGVVDAAAAATRLPWMWLVLPPALAAVATFDSIALSVGYGIAVAAVFVSYRTMDVGGAGPPGIVAVEGILLVVMAVGLALLVRTAAAAARGVDEDAARATAARASAASLAAAAAARADVDAVIHDRVLSALTVVAGSPRSPRVPEVARDALKALGAPTDLGAAGPVPVDELRERVAAAVTDMAPALTVTSGGTQDPAGRQDRAGSGDPAGRGDPAARDAAVPEAVARAVVEAAAEAVRNSLRHGHDDGRAPAVTVDVAAGDDTATVVVEVRDDGRGFRPEAVPPGRLGLEVSVRGRMRSVGGHADVRSEPGAGTVVVLRWPAQDDGSSDDGSREDGSREDGRMEDP